MTETTVGRGTPQRAPSTGEQPLPARRVVRLDGNVVAAPPPRPALTTDLVPPPLRPAPARPRALRVAAGLSWAAALAAAVCVVAAVLDRQALEARLTALAVEADAGSPPDVVADGVRATLVAVLGGAALAALLSLVWLRLVLRRRAWARWALLGTTLATLLLAALAQSVVAGGAELDRVAAVASALVAGAALVAVSWPSARRWLRSPGPQRGEAPASS